MKLHTIDKVISFSGYTLGLLVALSSTAGHAMTHSSMFNGSGKTYAAIFGGISSSNKFNINQYGTAFFPEDEGGPLAVNAFGRVNSRTQGLFGAHVGYQWSECPMAPAIELEGYYLDNTTFTANDVSNDTVRLPEHLFLDTFPTKAGIFLTNAVLNLNSPRMGRLHPYVGIGFGGAITSISNASSTQSSPLEAGINHFNSNPSDHAATFAAQAKLGLNVELSENLSLIVDYRWLYLSSTSYSFGSTVYPTHVETSNWQVKMDPQQYNIGTIGIQYSN